MSALRSQLLSFPEDLRKAGNDLRKVEEELALIQTRWKYKQVELYEWRHDEGRVEEIRGEMGEFKKMDGILREEMKVTRSLFLAAAITYSQTYCQEITEKVGRLLPQEIRDIVYGYLCERLHRVSIGPIEKFDMMLQRREIAAPRHKYIDRIETQLPQLFSHKYFAKEFLFELASVMYQKATMHIWDASDVGDFLHYDILQTDCVPKDHARKLSLVIYTDDFGQRVSSKKQIQKKLSQLEQLKSIKHREGFRLDLHLCISTMQHRPTVPRFHQILLPYLEDLKAAGFTIRLPLRKYRYGKSGKRDGSKMNQLQASRSQDPENWIVNDAELDAWKESKYIQNAFKCSARIKQRWLELDHQSSDWEYRSDSQDSESSLEGELSSDFEDYDLDSDEENPLV